MYPHRGLYKQTYIPQEADEIPRSKGNIESIGYAQFMFDYIEDKKLKNQLFNGMDKIDSLIAIKTKSNISFQVRDEIRIGNSKYEVQKVDIDHKNENKTAVYRFPHLANRSQEKWIVIA